jgi:hypothetical protein
MGPPLLTAERKQIRVLMTIELLQVLSVQSTRRWRDIVTLDESWIYLFNEHDLMWTAPGDIVVDSERHTGQSPKFMLMVVWNPIEFHVPCSESPPEGAQIQCTILYYYINDILVAISDRWRRTGATSCGCILIMLGHTPRKYQGITSVSIE